MSAKPLRLPVRLEDYTWFGVERDVILRKADGRVVAYVLGFRLRHKTRSKTVLPFILQKGEPIEAPGKPLKDVSAYQPEISFGRGAGIAIDDAVEAIRTSYLPPQALGTLKAATLRLVEEDTKRVVMLATAEVPSLASPVFERAFEQWDGIERVADGVTVLKLAKVQCSKPPKGSYVAGVPGVTPAAARTLILGVAIKNVCGWTADSIELKRTDAISRVSVSPGKAGTPFLR